MADSFIQLPADSTGKKLRTLDRGTPGHDQYVIPTDGRLISYRGRVATKRTPGRAGTVGAKLFALHNAAGSAVLVDVEKITVDFTATVIKAVTVLPPMIRLLRVTALPTNGTALTKVPEDSALISSASVTVFGDASADGTLSASALTVGPPPGSVVTQEYGPRMITAVGFELMDRAEFLQDSDERITLRALEGIVVFADYVLATQNAATDMWLVSCRWMEYTRP